MAKVKSLFDLAWAGTAKTMNKHFYFQLFSGKNVLRKRLRARPLKNSINVKSKGAFPPKANLIFASLYSREFDRWAF